MMQNQVESLAKMLVLDPELQHFHKIFQCGPGETIMEIFNLKPSKEVGILKVALKDAILDGEVENNHEEAKKYIINKGKEIGLKLNK